MSQRDDDPAPTRAEAVTALLRIAELAEALGSPAGFAAARAAWMDAARLSGLVAPAAPEPPPDAEARRVRLAELEVRRAAMERD